jgi:large repetitive protein
MNKARMAYRGHGHVLRAFFFGAWIFITLCAPAYSTEYAYDAAGRLVEVIASDGSRAVYQYDAVGNIASIRRIASSPLRIAMFAPPQGVAGSTVTLSGAGFDPIISNNQLTFNGVPAAVASATATTLVVNVPDAATTGKIAISNSLGTANSDIDFIVTPSLTPTISGFAPGQGPLGTDVVVNGTNFQTTNIENNVTFGYQPANVISSTPGSLVVRPSSSGKISVATPYGKAITGTDFYVVPAGYLPEDIQSAGRLLVDGAPVTVSTTAAGKKDILIFDGFEGQELGLGYSEVNTTPTGVAIGYRLFSPDGIDLTADTWPDLPGGGLPRLPRTGTYTLVIDPQTASSATVKLTLSSTLTGMIAVDGVSVISALPRVGQKARYTFSGNAGQMLGFGYSNVLTNPAGRNIRYKLSTADGTWLYSRDSSTSSSDNWPILPMTGTYVLNVAPANSVSASTTLTVSSDMTGVLVADAAATTFNTARPGQNGRYTFDGVGGANFSMSFANGTFSFLSIAVYKPDGTTLASHTGTTSLLFNLPTLPVTGRYTVFVDPSGASTGKVDMQLRTVPPDLVGTIAIDGAVSTLNLAMNQRGAFTFSGTAGQQLGAGYTAVSTNPPGQYFDSTLYKPDGTQLVSTSLSNASSSNWPVLPATGTYTLYVRAPINATASTMVAVSNDVAGTLVADAPVVTFSTARPGQNARYSFSGNVGDKYFLAFTNCTIGYAGIIVYKPDGTSLTSTGVTSSTYFNLPTLPATGIYTVFIDPSSVYVGKVDMQLKTVPSDLADTIAVDGAALSLSLAMNQRDAVTFSGIAGQQLGVGYTNVSTNPTGQSISYKLNRPDGTQLFSANWSTGSDGNLPVLPVTGIYTLNVLAPINATALTTLTVSSDVVGALVPGTPLTFSTTRAGQNGRFTFDGAAGHSNSLAFSGGTFPYGANIVVYKPDGSKLTSTSVMTLTSLNLSSLPVSGSYTVWVDPALGKTGHINIQLQ